MNRRALHIRLAVDEHQIIVQEAAHAGQSINRFIAVAAVGRALHARGLRGEPSPFARPDAASDMEDPAS